MEPIKILVIDDEHSERIKENFEDFKFNEVSCKTETALSIEEAKKKIKEKSHLKQFFDVMIVDMWLDKPNDGLSMFKVGASCIKIVLTAFPSVENCVESFKNGAFDYISKNTADAYLKLKKSVASGLEGRLTKPVDHFMLWLNQNQSKLIEEYGGKYIAVIDEIVVGVGDSHIPLEKEVKEKYPFHIPEITPIPEREEAE